MGVSLRARVLVGTAVWVGVLAGAAALLASPGVHEPLARTARSFAEDALGAPERERTFEVGDLRGVYRGAPVLAEGGGSRPPVGHVVGFGGRSVTVRLERNVPLDAPLRLTSLPPSRSLGEALALAVTPQAAERLGTSFRARLSAALEEVLLPGAEERLPAFWARVDPARDPEVRALFDRLGRDVLTRLEPLTESLSAEVAAAIKARFDFLDRVGLLWKVLRGDAQGLQKELAPVVRESAARWWQARSAEVFAVLADGAAAHRPALEGWLKGPVWGAARDELLLPVLQDRRARLEAEAEAVLREALEEVALEPEGGFRPRFASVLRTHLLGRGEALLFLGTGR